MMKEITVENIEQKFDSLFKEIDKLSEDMYENINVSLKQVMEAYRESKSN